MELLVLALGVFGVWYLTRKGEQPTQGSADAQKSGNNPSSSTGPGGKVVSSADSALRGGSGLGSGPEKTGHASDTTSADSPSTGIATSFSRENLATKLPEVKTLGSLKLGERAASWPAINRLPEPWRTLVLKTVESVNYGMLLVYELQCAGGKCPDPEDVQLQIDNLASKKDGIESSNFFAKGTVDPAISELEFLKYVMSVKKPTATPTRPWTEFDVLPTSYRDMLLTAVSNVNYDALFRSGIPVLSGGSASATRTAINAALAAIDNSAARVTITMSGVSEDDLNNAIALLQHVAAVLAGV